MPALEEALDVKRLVQTCLCLRKVSVVGDDLNMMQSVRDAVRSVGTVDPLCVEEYQHDVPISWWNS